MTDRINALIVVLDRDTRDDDVQPLIDAILHLRGVTTVTTNVVKNIDAVVAEARERRRIYEGMRALIYPPQEVTA